ncbi:MAG: hypothetical protein EAZ95_15300 [Bacteroidetes bacterium]|nr:MAG: hypothetical protein EAZ95_15300 [Bacteroidota bacterium]
MDFRYYLLLFFACVCLACQDKGEALRQRRLAEMVEKCENALQIDAENAIQALHYKIRGEGNSPEGINALTLAKEIRGKTTQILTTLKQEPNANIADYQAYLWEKMKVILDEENKNWFFSNVIDYKNLYVLHLEKTCLRKLGAYDLDVYCGIDIPLRVFSVATPLFENETYRAKMYMGSRNWKHAVDSLWVNGVLQMPNPSTISLPELKAGKHDLILKVKAISSDRTLDTTFSFPHTFHVLPRQK